MISVSIQPTLQRLSQVNRLAHSFWLRVALARQLARHRLIDRLAQLRQIDRVAHHSVSCLFSKYGLKLTLKDSFDLLFVLHRTCANVGAGWMNLAAEITDCKDQNQ